MTTFERIQAELKAWENPEGVNTSVFLQLTEPLRSLLSKMIRQGMMSYADLAADLGLSDSETEVIADTLVRCGFVKVHETRDDGTIFYKLRYARAHKPNNSTLQAWTLLLGDDDDK